MKPSKSPRAIEGASSRAAHGSECPVVVAAGLRSIIADLGLALVTLEQEGGKCTATKLVVNRAITTAHEILGTHNAADQQQAGGRTP